MHLKNNFKNTCVPTSQMKKVSLCFFCLQLLEQPQTTTGDVSGGRLRVACVSSLSRIQLSVTPWTVAYEAPLSMGFSRQEYWSGVSFPSPGDLPNPGIEHSSPQVQADSLPTEPPGTATNCHTSLDDTQAPWHWWFQDKDEASLAQPYLSMGSLNLHAPIFLSSLENNPTAAPTSSLVLLQRGYCEWQNLFSRTLRF